MAENVHPSVSHPTATHVVRKETNQTVEPCSCVLMGFEPYTPGVVKLLNVNDSSEGVDTAPKTVQLQASPKITRKQCLSE